MLSTQWSSLNNAQKKEMLKDLPAFKVEKKEINGKDVEIINDSEVSQLQVNQVIRAKNHLYFIGSQEVYFVVNIIDTMAELKFYGFIKN